MNTKPIEYFCSIFGNNTYVFSFYFPLSQNDNDALEIVIKFFSFPQLSDFSTLSSVKNKRFINYFLTIQCSFLHSMLVAIEW